MFRSLFVWISTVAAWSSGSAPPGRCFDPCSCGSAPWRECGRRRRLDEAVSIPVRVDQHRGVAIAAAGASLDAFRSLFVWISTVAGSDLLRALARLRVSIPVRVDQHRGFVRPSYIPSDTPCFDPCSCGSAPWPTSRRACGRRPAGFDPCSCGSAPWRPPEADGGAGVDDVSIPVRVDQHRGATPDPSCWCVNPVSIPVRVDQHRGFTAVGRLSSCVRFRSLFVWISTVAGSGSASSTSSSSFRSLFVWISTVASGSAAAPESCGSGFDPCSCGSAPWHGGFGRSGSRDRVSIPVRVDQHRGRVVRPGGVPRGRVSIPVRVDQHRGRRGSRPHTVGPPRFRSLFVWISTVAVPKRTRKPEPGPVSIPVRVDQHRGGGGRGAGGGGGHVSIPVRVDQHRGNPAATRSRFARRVSIPVRVDQHRGVRDRVGRLIIIRFRSLFVWISTVATRAIQLGAPSDCFDPCSCGSAPWPGPARSAAAAGPSFDPCSCGSAPWPRRARRLPIHSVRFRSLFVWISTVARQARPLRRASRRVSIPVRVDQHRGATGANYLRKSAGFRSLFVWISTVARFRLRRGRSSDRVSIPVRVDQHRGLPWRKLSVALHLFRSLFVWISTVARRLSNIA